MGWKDFVRHAALLALQSAKYYTDQTSVKWDDAAVEALTRLVEEYLSAVGPAVRVQMTGAETVDVRTVVKQVASELA